MNQNIKRQLLDTQSSLTSALIAERDCRVPVCDARVVRNIVRSKKISRRLSDDNLPSGSSPSLRNRPRSKSRRQYVTADRCSSFATEVARMNLLSLIAERNANV